MANMRNKWEFYGSILEALGVDYTDAELKNNETLRAKLLEGLGVEHTYDDVNQYPLWREKLVEGIGNMSGGGGGFDPSNYEILEFTEDPNVTGRYICEKTFKEIYDDTNTNYAIYLDPQKFTNLYNNQFVKDGYYTLACKNATEMGTPEDPTLEYGLAFNLVGYGGEKSVQAVTLNDFGTESEYFEFGNIVS